MTKKNVLWEWHLAKNFVQSFNFLEDDKGKPPETFWNDLRQSGQT